MYTLNNPEYKKAREKAREIVKKMTLEEKVIQLTQYIGGDNSYNPESADAGETNAGRCGSFLAACGINEVNDIQKIAVEYTPFNIPIITGNDVIHGYRTTMPIPLAMSCTFDVDLVRAACRVAATEARCDNVHWTFSPMVDIARDSRWGRVAEGYGEDTFLCTKMAAAAVKGYQNDGGVMACMKHYVGYSACEGGRDYNGCDMSDQTLFNVYLPPFKAGIDAGVATFMSSFNEINGIPCSGSKKMLTDILRGKLGFDGFVVSDYDSVLELINHGYAEDKKDAVLKGYGAGVDVIMSGNMYNNYLPELVREGKISEEQIDASVERIIAAKYVVGVMDEPFLDTEKPRPFVTPEHRKVAYETAVNSFVLLENDGILPIIPEKYAKKKIGLTGPVANDKNSVLGCWSSLKNTNFTVSIKEAFEKAFCDSEIVYEAGYSFDEDTSFEKGVQAMKDCDVIVACMAEYCSESGEATSKVSLELSEEQLDYLDMLFATGKPVIVLVSAGRPLIMTEIRKKAAAILYIWAPGTECGNAVCDVMTGKRNPCGRTTISFPYNVGQMPLYYNHKSTGRPAADKSSFESKYIDCPIGPLYPFGYGLSYTKFEYTDAALSADKLTEGETLTVSCKVKNTGHFAGSDAVQLYVRDLFGSITRPVKELKGFEKIFLEPGEEREVSFEITPEMLAFWNADMEYVTEPGAFKVWIAHDSGDNALEFDFSYCI